MSSFPAMTAPSDQSAAPAAPSPDGVADGRRERGARSRTKIVDALFALIQEGDVNPSAAQVAERAKVGLRTVFRHFEEMDSLYRELTERIEAMVMPTVLAPFTAPDWRGRLRELVARRADVFERIFPYKLAGNLRRYQSEYLMRDYQRTVELERDRLRVVLPPQILQDQVLFSALEMATGFQTWRRLRQDQGLAPADAERVMLHVVEALVAGR